MISAVLFKKKMKPLRIYIEKSAKSTLDIDEIKYTFKTLLVTAGFGFVFTSDKNSEKIDICYSKNPTEGCKMFIKMESVERERIGIPVRVVRSNGLTLLSFTDDLENKEAIVRVEEGTYLLNDVILSTFYLLSGWQEKYVSRDRWDRHNIEEVYLYKKKMLSEPLINCYALFLKQMFTRYSEPLPLSAYTDETKRCIVLKLTK